MPTADATDEHRTQLAAAITLHVDHLTTQAVSLLENYTLRPLPGTLEDAAGLLADAHEKVLALHGLAHP